MSRLFDRAAVFTDIHFGAKSDSEQHNRDCLAFVEWFCRRVRESQCDTVIFMGDWFDNRSRLRVDTVDYSWRAAQMLSDLHTDDVSVHWIIGNHDIFFRNSRDIHSLPYMQSHVHVVNTMVEIGDCLLVPWLVGSEFAEVPSYEVKYVFGHFELPLFLVNENVVMPDKGGLHSDHFTHPRAVFSGHFHKRQMKVNKHGIPIYYIGNAFPHNFNDVNDRNRGCMILEWDNEPEFEVWPDAPVYERTTVSQLFADLEAGKTDANVILEVTDDVGLEVEEAMELRGLIGEQFREVRLRPARRDLDAGTETDIGEDAQSVDEMVVEHLRMLDTDGSDYDPELLVELYQSVGTQE